MKIGHNDSFKWADLSHESFTRIFHTDFSHVIFDIEIHLSHNYNGDYEKVINFDYNACVQFCLFCPVKNVR